MRLEKVNKSVTKGSAIKPRVSNTLNRKVSEAKARRGKFISINFSLIRPIFVLL